MKHLDFVGHLPAGLFRFLLGTSNGWDDVCAYNTWFLKSFAFLVERKTSHVQVVSLYKFEAVTIQYKYIRKVSYNSFRT